MGNQLIKEVIRYVKDTLAAALVIKPWNGSLGLPFFLKEQYTFYQTEIIALPCILIVAKGRQDATPALIRKHIDLLQPKAGGAEIIYVQKQLSSFNRKRLVEQKVSFIIPGNQMYLPLLGVDFREHFKRLQSLPKTLSPSAQVVILHALLKNEQDVLRLNDLAKEYGYSVMTMSRAFREIESLGLAEVTVKGRKHEMILKGTRQEVWKNVLNYLRNPVIQRFYPDLSVLIPEGIYAGLSALAKYSTLAEPGDTVLAISSSIGRLLTQRHGRSELSIKDLHCHEIEVWSYDPKLFAIEGVVDRLSLFLTLRDEKDERVEAALEQMMKEMTW
jgi:hypothetical protein